MYVEYDDMKFTKILMPVCCLHGYGVRFMSYNLWKQYSNQ